jgi:hypothetical protein
MSCTKLQGKESYKIGGVDKEKTLIEEEADMVTNGRWTCKILVESNC